MQTILFDTDYLIDFLHGESMVLPLIREALYNDLAHISILSIYEIYAGMRPEEERVTEYFIGAFHIEPVTEEIAKKAGMMRFQYRKKGITLSIVDCIIAETARSKNHLVATKNKKHYPNIDLL